MKKKTSYEERVREKILKNKEKLENLGINVAPKAISNDKSSRQGAKESKKGKRVANKQTQKPVRVSKRIRVTNEADDEPKVSAQSSDVVWSFYIPSKSLKTEEDFYQHTLMRVRTMSGKALKRRVAAIERANGKNSKKKLFAFVEVLSKTGPEDVLNLAKAALERIEKQKSP
eukprot:maker-scaffold_11-snap-gene-6.10-mRNA-1 protein AED:0.00 eAED:0.00 QI:9/0.5/0.66/1/1/1/3/199/171